MVTRHIALKVPHQHRKLVAVELAALGRVGQVPHAAQVLHGQARALQHLRGETLEVAERMGRRETEARLEATRRRESEKESIR